MERGRIRHPHRLSAPHRRTGEQNFVRSAHPPQQSGRFRPGARQRDAPPPSSPPPERIGSPSPITEMSKRTARWISPDFSTPRRANTVRSSSRRKGNSSSATAREFRSVSTARTSSATPSCPTGSRRRSWPTGWRHSASTSSESTTTTTRSTTAAATVHRGSIRNGSTGSTICSPA